MLAVADLIESLEEIDRLQVLVGAEHVGNPFPGVPGIVELEHRAHGINAQAVEVIAIEPEQGVAEEKVANFGPAVIEDLGAPVAVLAQSGVGMLVKVSAIEI